MNKQALMDAALIATGDDEQSCPLAPAPDGPQQTVSPRLVAFMLHCAAVLPLLLMGALLAYAGDAMPGLVATLLTLAFVGWGLGWGYSVATQHPARSVFVLAACSAGIMLFSVGAFITVVWIVVSVVAQLQLQ